MNAKCFKTVFSERLGCLVAVGEHACSQGKSSGVSAFGGAAFVASVLASAGVFMGALVLSQVFVGLAWAQPAANALPTGAAVVQGAASLAQSANKLHITQASQRAAINWQSFDIGASAKVNVVQPNAQAVLLNRVVGQSPSQIFGKLQANGHVILVNRNGVLFGKDGSVNAASFTASTLGITDANFMAGNMLYERNGSTAGVVNQGEIEVSPGGYVALLGASVNNEGKIIAPKGGVALGAAETIKVPVTGSGRIKLELTAGDINASVKNSGSIVAEGGQVYMQALALNRAAAQILQSGSIDTTGEQGGAVHLLADGGKIRVDGSIKANSDNGKAGGDIYIGRDKDTNVLAALGDVSGAQLESRGGFVETSGDVLSTTGTRVKSAEWLLDPYNITIASSLPSGTAYSSNYTSGADSVILASDIVASLNAGTSVSIQTGAGGASAGDINVNADIVKASGASASLTLTAHRDVLLNNSIKTTSNDLNIRLNALTGKVTGAGGLAAGSGGVITVNTTTNGELSGIIESGALLKTGAGQIKLSAVSGATYGINTFAGGTTISQGTLLLGNGNGRYNNTAGAGAITLGDANTASSNVSLLLEKGKDVSQDSGKLTRTVTVSNNGSGTATLGGASAGGTGWTAFGGPLVLHRNINFSDGTGDRTSIDGLVSGTGNITLTSGRAIMSSSTLNTFTGDFIVNSGTTLQLNSALALSANNNLVNNGTTRLNGGTTLAINALTGAGSFTSWNLGSSSAATLSLGNSNGSGTYAGTVSQNGVVLSVVKNGSGTQVLTGANSYTGTTTINTGTLQIGNATTTGTLGTGAVTNNGHLTFNRSNAMTVGNVIGGSGTVNQAGTGTTTLAADNSYSGATTVSAGTLQVGSGGSSGTLGNSTGVTLYNNANLTFSKNVNTVIDKAIGGQGNLTANITGDLSLNSNVALTGTNTINLMASGAITRTSGSLAATNLYMSATNGGIGEAANRIQTQVNQLSLSSGGNVFVTEANAVSVAARTTANNGSLDIVTTQGSLSVGAVNGLAGITAHGSGNVSLSGTTSTGTGVFVGNHVTASNGDITIHGSTASTVNPDAGVKSAALVSGKNITLLASATAASGSVLGYYGAGGGFSASGQLNLSGTSSNGGNGFYSYTGSIVAGSGITIAGSSAGGQGLGLDNLVSLTNTTGAIHLSGTSNDATKQAIGLRGASITNGGGDIVLNAVNGVVFTGSGNINWGNGVLTNSITSNGSGFIRVNAGNNNLASSSSIDGSVLTITQNSNAGVIVSTSGTGNLTAPKVINNGSGDVMLAAGNQIAAGTATGGQVLTVAGNSVTQASTGKTYVYSGAAASTGLLSRISASLANLYYEGGSHAWNAAFNQAYGASIAGGENTQVLFRESTAPSFNLNLGAIALSKTYGQADPDVFAAVQAAYAGTTLTKEVAGPGGGNTFAVAADDVLPTLTGTRTGGHNASETPYAYALTVGLNTVVTDQPSLLINKAPLTVVLQGLVQKEYDGTTAASGLSSAHYNVTGWATVSGSTEGASVNQPLAAYASAGVANNNGSGAVTATLQASNFVANAGTDMANYSLPPSASGNVGLITRAPLSVKVNDTAIFVTQDPNAAFDQGFSAGSNQLKNGERLIDVLGPLSRTYIGSANPGAGVYSGVYGFSTVPAADNYTVYPVLGGLTVARADQLLLTVGSASASYGTLAATHAGASANLVSAQYCLVSTNCNGANIAHLTMSNQGAGRWTATDSSNSTISFDTVVDTTGKISGAGFVKTGNYTFFTNNLSTTGTVNFNGTVVSAGVLSVDPVPVSLNVASVTKVYDGTTSVANLALMPTGVLSNDLVSVASGGGNFGGVNAGPQSFSLTGLNLQGADRANYYIASNGVTGTGSITPKTLSLSAWALNKVYDGSRAATVNWGALSGLVGSEQLGVSALGAFASADVGFDKAVYATFNLADGANGGLASNYVLATQTLTASILKKDEAAPRPASRPVQPESWPQASRLKSSAVVYQPSPVASTSQPALGRIESGPCSDEPTDSCVCENSPLEGVQICYVPKGALDNETTKTAKSEGAARQ
jgi:filamentous hemagglutinin family protein